MNLYGFSAGNCMFRVIVLPNFLSLLRTFIPFTGFYSVFLSSVFSFRFPVSSVSFCRVRFFRRRILSDRIPEFSHIFSQRKIFPVGISDQPRVIQMEFSILIQTIFVHIHADHFCEKHIVASQLDDLRHPALYIHRAFLNSRRMDLL